MRLSRRQIQTLQRHSRATRVWRRIGVKLDSSTRVVVQDGRVRIVRRQGR